MTSLRSTSVLCLLCVLCALCGSVSLFAALAGRWAASRRAAGSAAPRPCHLQRRPARRRQGDPLLLRPASRSRSSRSSTTARSRRRSRSPPTAGSASTPSASAPPAGISRAAHLLGRRPAGRRREGAEQRLRHAAEDPAQRHRPRRRRQRGRRLLRRRGKKGQRLSAEVEGMRLGNTLFDPYVAILDSKRFELAAADDSPLLGQDGVLLDRRPGGRHVHRPGPRERLRRQRRLPVSAARRHLPAADGRRSRRRQARRGGRGHVPRRPGRADQAEGQAARRRRPRSSASSPRTPAASRPSADPVPPVSDVGNVVEAEPNDTHATGDARRELPAPSTASSTRPGDVDYFRFTAKKGQTFDVHCYARRLGSPLDPVMTICNADGGGHRRQRRRRRAGQLLPLHRPGRRRVRPQRHRPPGQGRADLLLPRRVHAGRSRRLTRQHPQGRRCTRRSGRRSRCRAATAIATLVIASRARLRRRR